MTSGLRLDQLQSLSNNLLGDVLGASRLSAGMVSDRGLRVVVGEEKVEQVWVASSAAIEHLLEHSVEDEGVDALRASEQPAVLQLPQVIEELGRGELVDGQLLVRLGQIVPVHSAVVDVVDLVALCADLEDGVTLVAIGSANRYEASSRLPEKDRAS